MRSGWSAATLVAVLGACSAEGDPAPAQYTLNFPSTAAAVATESVQVLVFEASAATRGTLCATLLQKRKAGQELPKRLVEGPLASPCDAQRKPVTVPFGERALLVIARKENKDYLLGCTLQTIGSGDPPAAVYLTPASSQVTTPATKCPQLSSFCAKSCPP